MAPTNIPNSYIINIQYKTFSGDACSSCTPHLNQADAKQMSIILQIMSAIRTANNQFRHVVNPSKSRLSLIEGELRSYLSIPGHTKFIYPIMNLDTTGNFILSHLYHYIIRYASSKSNLDGCVKHFELTSDETDYINFVATELSHPYKYQAILSLINDIHKRSINV